MWFSISHYPANSGWDTLWKTYSKELCVGVIKEYRSSAEVIACLKSLGLKYDEHSAPNAFDITECFNPGSCHGERLLSFMTGSDKFHESFTPEIRAGMLDLLRRKCSAEKDGKVLFNSDLSCILVHAVEKCPSIPLDLYSVSLSERMNKINIVQFISSE